jgi:cell wall-associated NlpC family hydrolase
MTLDKRLHAFRPDLADARLQGKVEAERFVEGKASQVIAPITGVHREADQSSMQLAQALFGETLRIFEEKDGFAFVQLDQDGYVGYIVSTALSATVAKETHRVSVPLTLHYPKPDLKSSQAFAMPMNARVSVTSVDGDYVSLATGGYMFGAHLSATRVERDFVTVAERFLHVPYLWGGESFAGIDCSGLVQTAFEACGIHSLRDSDMQENTIGSLVANHSKLQRGDLVFWKGHVGIMKDTKNLLHANGYHMMVAIEPLQNTITRILAKGGGPVTSIKRL